ncbi:MAG: ABC transporter ATP-binding protein [Actinomycetota bacterium]|nr:ABC transporter ATP-binding protein [Actinomycetota bacterium]
MSGTAPVEPALAIQDLSVCFDTAAGPVRAVEEVSYQVTAGRTVGVVGESGCGKTATVLAALGLLPRPPGRVTSGRVLLGGRDLLTLTARELRRVRGREVGMIFQDPMSALHPTYRVIDQVAEAIQAHDRDLRRGAARKRAIELLEEVGVPEAGERGRAYPHEWSGGMRQRAMIAMAVANRPRVLIADEPTTALDVTVQAQILELLQRLQRQQGLAVVIISHDLGVIAETADDVVVMYAGRVVEKGTAREVFASPRHPYTAGLLASLPSSDAGDQPLVAIPGAPPYLADCPSGCAFHPRCSLGRERARCTREVPELRSEEGSTQGGACHFSEELGQPRQRQPGQQGADEVGLLR